MMLNTVVNYSLLLGALRILGIRYQRLRMLIAASFGGLYSGICLIRGQSLSAAIAVRIISLAFIGMIAFGIGRQSIKGGIIFQILNFSLEGMLKLMQRTDEITVTVCACSISFLCRFLINSRGPEKRISSIIIYYCGKIVKFKALHDTGNTLIDPITGENMLVIGPRAASELTGLTKEELASPINTLREGRVRGLWLVPFSSVGNENGLMLAMRFSNAILDGKRVKIVAALAAEGMNDYDALIGG